ncbi:MAG: nicotinamide-nucleotide amidohydrolase family protein [Victivallaceae bacterium]|nr:nicotinamide-nucleotide amidohydrolase family protein [Victivallaceae bacterium]
MNIALIFTGTELLEGGAINSNQAVIGQLLTRHGAPPAAAFTAGDGADAISGALADALRLADGILVCGGLGSTDDDLTLETVCRFFGLESTIDPTLRDKLTSYWQSRHSGRMPKNMLRQARVPQGAKIIPNACGSASGLAFDTVYGKRNRHIVLLPGPPAEFESMAPEAVRELMTAAGKKQLHTAGFLAVGRPELELQRQLTALPALADARIAYCAGPEGTRLTFSAPTRRAALALAGQAAEICGESALPEGQYELVPAVFQRLKSHKLTLATAESCTGGMVGAKLTDLAGISSVYLGGAVTYSNQLKHKLLGVPQKILDEYGAVSRECAEAMVRGAARRFGADCAIAVTGIAGPDGGSETKPVGLVYVAVKAGRRKEVRECHFYGSRRQIRERAAATALGMLYLLAGRIHR